MEARMRGLERLVIGLIGVGMLAGCRATTKVVEEPRVDIELAGGGNRGFIVGTPPTTPVSKTTRQVVEADIELPAFGGGGTATQANTSVPASELNTPAPIGPDLPLDVNVGEPELSAAAGSDQYVVKNGESLWTIAAKPEVFGDGNRWRALFDANRDLLKQPGDLRAGMTLRVPRDGSVGALPDPELSAEEQRFVK
jgi:hypothetical protein